MNKSLIQYDSSYFIHDMHNLFHESEKAIKKDTLYEIENSKKFSSINLISNLEHLIEKKIKLYGIYNCNVKYFSAEHVLALQHLIGINRLEFISNISNDSKNSQYQFEKVIRNWMKENND